ncbi:MAG: phosphomannomutase [Desulfobulbaceae bacterium]|nr:MAG: phosphomannomutase [Desulfobulbaceae bacterium]
MDSAVASIPTCFKAYDIRGRVPEQLDANLAYRIGWAFARHLRPRRVVLGHDIRLSSPELAAAVKQGLTGGGAAVLELGLCGTEEVYFAVAHLQADGGIMVTASHNPADYNGMKLVREQSRPIAADTGLAEIAALAMAARERPVNVHQAEQVRATLPSSVNTSIVTSAGGSDDGGNGSGSGIGDSGSGSGVFPAGEDSSARRQSTNAQAPICAPPPDWREHTTTAYIDHLLSYINPAKLKPLIIIANPGNGGAGAVVDRLAPHLPCKFIRQQWEPDGRFPHGVPNPQLPENQELTAQAVRQHGADLGLAWDGDFDRCFFFDHEGNFVEGYYLVGLLAQVVLARHPGGKIIHDPRLVWNTIEIVKKAGGVPRLSKTGHALIKEKMRAEDAVYGGEMSAHHYFRKFFYCDSGMIPWLLIVELLSVSGKTLAQLVADCRRAYPVSGEINSRTPDPAAAIARVKSWCQNFPGECDDTDGFSFSANNFRLNIRSSNTEPLLRLNVETRGDQALLANVTQDVLDLINH